jgi:hypothetical protein
MGTVMLIFSILAGGLTVAKDVVGLDVALAQNTPGKTPVAAILPLPNSTVPGRFVPVPNATAPVRFAPADLAHQPIRTMEPIWSPEDRRR